MPTVVHGESNDLLHWFMIFLLCVVVISYTFFSIFFLANVSFLLATTCGT